MTIAIAPRFTLGGGAGRLFGDRWSAVTADGSMASHVEHTVAVPSTAPRSSPADRGGQVRRPRPRGPSAVELLADRGGVADVRFRPARDRRPGAQQLTVFGRGRRPGAQQLTVFGRGCTAASCERFVGREHVLTLVEQTTCSDPHRVTR